MTIAGPQPVTLWFRSRCGAGWSLLGFVQPQHAPHSSEMHEVDSAGGTPDGVVHMQTCSGACSKHLLPNDCMCKHEIHQLVCSAVHLCDPQPVETQQDTQAMHVIFVDAPSNEFMSEQACK